MRPITRRRESFKNIATYCAYLLLLENYIIDQMIESKKIFTLDYIQKHIIKYVLQNLCSGFTSPVLYHPIDENFDIIDWGQLSEVLYDDYSIIKKQ